MQNQFDIKYFIKQGEQFLSQILSEAVSAGLKLDDLIADHLCFRVETVEQYEFYKLQLSKTEIILTESFVNGRPIVTYKMSTPFCIGHRMIQLLELPSPKIGSDYILGFEHVEFVINQHINQFEQKYPNLIFSKSGNKITNPEFGISFTSGKIKFHYLSLDKVIQIEKANINKIIFDLDGTLVDSRETIYQINQAVFSDVLNRSVSINEVKDKFHSEFSSLCKNFQITDKYQIQNVSDLWSKKAFDFKYKLFDGIYEMLNVLKENSVEMHVWSARDYASGVEILKANNIESFFSSYSFSNNKNSKPDRLNLCIDINSSD